MRPYWKPEKNKLLIQERGISFEEIEQALADGGLKGMRIYQGQKKIHFNQVLLLVEAKGALWEVPAIVKHPDIIFFRTAYQVEEE
jgi:hypothetical protein